MNYKINTCCRLIEMFAGYGSQAIAMDELGVDYEHYKISEWCIPSVNLYHSVHTPNKYEKLNYSKEEAIQILLDYGVSQNGKDPLTEDNLRRKSEKWLNDVISKFRATNNIGSICNVKGKDLEIVDTDEFTYILTYSFPCQDLSLSGKQKGMQKGSGTRSGLLWEVERLLNECEELNGKDGLPQVLLMENVPQVHGTKQVKDGSWPAWLDFLESKGYKNFYSDLNAADYGIPQSRKRCFMISILSDYEYEFPETIPLTCTVKDYLEDEVDKKYYITSDKARELIDKLILDGRLGEYLSSGGQLTGNMNYNRIDKIDTSVAKTLCARDYKGFGTGFDTMNGVVEICKK